MNVVNKSRAFEVPKIQTVDELLAKIATADAENFPVEAPAKAKAKAKAKAEAPVVDEAPVEAPVEAPDADVLHGHKNDQGDTVGAKGVATRAGSLTKSLTVEQILTTYGTENTSNAKAILAHENDIQSRFASNLEAYKQIGEKLMLFTFQATYTKEGKTLTNTKVLKKVLLDNGLDSYAESTTRAPYIMLVNRWDEMPQLQEWRDENAKTKIVPLSELAPDSIRLQFNKWDKAKALANSTENTEANVEEDNDAEDTSSTSKDTLEKLIQNIIDRTNNLGLNKATILAEVSKAQF